MKNLISNFVLASFCFVAITAVSSCKKNSTSADCTGITNVSYATDIAPLMTQNCTSCHNSSSAAGGYNLTSYANVSSNADIILKSMRHSGAKAMPEGSSKLATSVVDKFDCWIQQGKPNN